MLLMKKIERVNIMCDNSNNNTKCNCIAEILKVINILQNEICPGDSCLETCTRAFFGPNAAAPFNTRPVTLYTCDGTLIAIPVSNTPGETTTSSTFRVEKVDGCCATFRVLAENPEPTALTPYVATNSFFTMNLNCVCALRCLPDTFVECI